MKVLYILKQDASETAKTFMEVHKKHAEVTVVDLRKDKNYDDIIDKIVSSDKVITW